MMADFQRSEPQQEVPGHADDGRRYQRARPEHQRGNAAVPLHVAHICGDRVAEQHQHQRQRRDDLKRRRVEPQVDETETRGADQHAEDEEDRHLRQPAPIDDTGEERGQHDDDADQREAVDQTFGEHGGKVVDARRQTPAFQPTVMASGRSPRGDPRDCFGLRPRNDTPRNQRLASGVWRLRSTQ